METGLRKWGNSSAAIIPKAAMAEAGFSFITQFL